MQMSQLLQPVLTLQWEGLHFCWRAASQNRWPSICPLLRKTLKLLTITKSMSPRCQLTDNPEKTIGAHSTVKYCRHAIVEARAQRFDATLFLAWHTFTSWATPLLEKQSRSNYTVRTKRYSTIPTIHWMVLAILPHTNWTKFHTIVAQNLFANWTNLVQMYLMKNPLTWRA